MTDQSAPAPADIDEALFMLQAEPIVLRKDKEGQVGSQKTRYADLVQANEVILARLHDLGVLWKTKPTVQLIPGPNGQQDPRFVLEYSLLHVASGTAETGTYPLPAGANPMQNGSAITYARRYALVAITNAVAEDDDDDGQGYRGRPGHARRETIPRAAAERPETAQRQAAPRGEKSRPAQQPEPPPARARATAATPATEPATPPGPRGSVDRKQHAHMHALWNELGYGGDENRDRRLTITAKILRLDALVSSSELTREQADQVIAALTERRKSRPEPGPAPEPARPEPAARQPGQQSRTAREAVYSGDEGAEDAPWEGRLPV